MPDWIPCQLETIRRRFLPILLTAASLAGCGVEATAPRGAPGPDATAPGPPATIRIDTTRTSAGVTNLISLGTNDLAAGTVTARLLVAPIAGDATIREPGVLEYTPADDAFGEDVLSYELSGASGAPVIGTMVFLISAVPDDQAGVAILRQAAMPSHELPDRVRYQGVDPSDPRIVALKPLVAEILAAYQPTFSALDSARALRDWVARTAVHPYPPFHPDGSTANLSVLPEGTQWADVNLLYSERLAGDSNYWTQLYQDGPQMLDRLLGTQSAGPDAADGMMERIGPARYRIRNLTDYRFVLCSYQSQMLIALWGAAGLQGMMVPTVGHDASAVFIADLGKWVYMDPTYNDEYVIAGSDTPLSPLELVTYSTSGYVSRLESRSTDGPTWDRPPYIAASSDPAASYVGEHPAGFVLIGSQLNNMVTSPFGVPVRNVQLNNTALAADPFFGDQGNFARVAPSVAFPDLGVSIATVESAEGGALITLVSSVPGHVRFERRDGDGTWHECDSTDFVKRGTGRVEYRSMDATGATGMTALIDI